MNFRILVIFSILTCLQLLSAHRFHGNFWQTSAPGELLNELDLITRDGLENVAYVKPFARPEFEIENTTNLLLKKPPIATKKARRKSSKNKSKPTRRATAEEENESAALTSAAVEHDDEQDDYDRAYEQFVNRYFNDAAEHYLADNNDNEDDADLTSASQEASNLSGSIESDIVYPLDDAEPYHTQATKPKKSAKSSSKKNCRKVHRKGEICFICKNPRNDEHSETCSYEHSSEPEAYAYESERKFRKSRDSEDTDDDDGGSGSVGADNSNSKEFAAESKLLSQTIKLPKNESTSNEFESNSSCMKRSAGGKACYYCRNSLGKLSVNCFATDGSILFDSAASPSINKKPSNENSHKQRRIFKRTLSYVFEKGHDSNGTLNLPNEHAKNSHEYLN